jgi:predicted dehydrogenase
MKKIKTAIVGLGYWGPNLIRNFRKHPSFEVVGGCDLIDENLTRISQEFPSISLTKSYSDLLNNPELDLIAIATPPETHYKLGKMALEAGKHLWIEKPFTTSYTHAKELYEIAQKKNLSLHVDLPFMFYGPVLKMKELIEKKEIGKPFYYTSIRTNLGLIQKEVDVIWDLAPHDFSIIFSLFPTIKPVKIDIDGSSHVGDAHKKQIANLVVHFDNGLCAYIHLSWLSPAKIRLITIGGEEKMILFDDIEPTEKIKIYDKKVQMKPGEITPFKPVYRSGDVWIPSFDQTEALYKELDYLAKEMHSKKLKYVTAKVELQTLQILEEAKNYVSYSN